MEAQPRALLQHHVLPLLDKQELRVLNVTCKAFRGLSDDYVEALTLYLPAHATRGGRSGCCGCFSVITHAAAYASRLPNLHSIALRDPPPPSGPDSANTRICAAPFLRSITVPIQPKTNKPSLASGDPWPLDPWLSCVLAAAPNPAAVREVRIACSGTCRRDALEQLLRRMPGLRRVELGAASEAPAGGREPRRLLVVGGGGACALLAEHCPQLEHLVVSIPSDNAASTRSASPSKAVSGWSRWCGGWAMPDASPLDVSDPEALAAQAQWPAAAAAVGAAPPVPELLQLAPLTRLTSLTCLSPHAEPTPVGRRLQAVCRHVAGSSSGSSSTSGLAAAAALMQLQRLEWGDRWGWEDLQPLSALSRLTALCMRRTPERRTCERAPRSAAPPAQLLRAIGTLLQLQLPDMPLDDAMWTCVLAGLPCLTSAAFKCCRLRCGARPPAPQWVAPAGAHGLPQLSLDTLVLHGASHPGSVLLAARSLPRLASLKCTLVAGASGASGGVGGGSGHETPGCAWRCLVSLDSELLLRGLEPDRVDAAVRLELDSGDSEVPPHLLVAAALLTGSEPGAGAASTGPALDPEFDFKLLGRKRVEVDLGARYAHTASAQAWEAFCGSFVAKMLGVGGGFARARAVRLQGLHLALLGSAGGSGGGGADALARALAAPCGRERVELVRCSGLEAAGLARLAELLAASAGARGREVAVVECSACPGAELLRVRAAGDGGALDRVARGCTPAPQGGCVLRRPGVEVWVR